MEGGKRHSLVVGACVVLVIRQNGASEAGAENGSSDREYSRTQ